MYSFPRQTALIFTKFIKILNSIKSLCRIFRTKLFQIFSNTYFGSKCPKKSEKKDFELYQVFIHSFLCQNNKIFTKIFEIYQVVVTKCSNTPILYANDKRK